MSRMAGTTRVSRSRTPNEAKSRAAGSMNTTISDMATFTAALVRGDGLTPASRAEMTKPSLHITTRSAVSGLCQPTCR